MENRSRIEEKPAHGAGFSFYLLRMQGRSWKIVGDLFITELFPEETQDNCQSHKTCANENNLHTEVHKRLLTFLKKINHWRAYHAPHQRKNYPIGRDISEKHGRRGLSKGQHARYVGKTGQIKLLKRKNVGNLNVAW